jgi:hypothetical protein
MATFVDLSRGLTDSSRREKNVALGQPLLEFVFVRNFKNDSNKMLRQIMLRFYLDFEHWGLPLSVSILGKDDLIMVSVFCVTLAIYTGSMDD